MDVRRPASRVPWPVWVLAAVGAALFLLPLVGLLARAGWSSLWHDLRSPTARDALWLSLQCSLWSTVLSVVLGVPLAWVLARSRLPGRSLLRAPAWLHPPRMRIGQETAGTMTGRTVAAIANARDPATGRTESC